MRSQVGIDDHAAREPQAAVGGGGCAPDVAPRLVTRGETHHCDVNTAASAAFIDWLAFTVTPPPGQSNRLDWVARALSIVFCVPAEGWESKERGWNGYTSRIDLGQFGLLAHGGEGQRGTFHVELNAQACRRILDWNAVRLWGELYEAHATRIDLAHDDLDGERIDIAKALQLLRDGRFMTNGRPPAAELIDDLGSNKGKTLYVGRRQSGKLLRVYEKGKQLGDPDSPWVRVEVELRNKSRVVPWDVVMRPGQYLAGAYPALAFLNEEQERLRTVRRVGEISYAAMVKNLRTQGGKSLNVMRIVHGGDASSVLAQLVREGVPKRLSSCSLRDLPGMSP